MYKQLKQQLDVLAQRLNAHPKKQRVVSALQQHTSYICQSEQLNDYITESQALIEQINYQAIEPTEEEERIAKRLSDQLLLLTALCNETTNVPQQTHRVSTARANSSQAYYQKLSEYQSYLTRFDDKLRQLKQLGEAENQALITTTLQRRQRCVTAIEQLEKKITAFEQGTIRRK